MRSGSPFQSWVTFRMPVAIATASTTSIATAIRRMPRLRGTSPSRERCHHEGPWYSSSIEGNPCARCSRIAASLGESVSYAARSAHVKLGRPLTVV